MARVHCLHGTVLLLKRSSLELWFLLDVDCCAAEQSVMYHQAKKVKYLEPVYTIKLNSKKL